MKHVMTQSTIFPIIDEYGEKSTISISRRSADLLVKNILDVHCWLQNTYLQVVKESINKKLKLSRRKIGDIVRIKAIIEAHKYEKILF